ncbi:MAG: mechanosensitive ion channel domain-containing protein [Cyanobacteria bacterium P01_G01_bin.39]
MDKAFVGWLLALGVGFPLLNLLLVELSAILKKQQHPLATAVKKIQLYLLPPLALLLVMRKLLQIAHTENSTRMVESITWIAVILTGVSLINAILTTKPQKKPFQIKVPNLFFQLFRTTVALGIVYYLLTGVWGIDISQLTTAVGVGSIAVGLALQDTLSNLVSGLLILIAKPFKVGDWISVNGCEARVMEQNWWSVTVKHNTWGYQYVIPNSTLANATITNYGTAPVWKKVEIGFSYDDPPNKVIPALSSLVKGIPQIKDQQGYAGVAYYGDSSINYELWYRVPADGGAWGAFNTIMSRIYYMAKREGFTIPYPIQIEFGIGEERQLPSKIPQVEENRQPEMNAYLRSLAYFFTANDTQIEQLASRSHFRVYGAGEIITQEGKPDDGIYAVYQGRVKSSVTDNLGTVHSDREFDQGDVFGETAIYPGEVSSITTVAQSDTELIVIPAAEIVRLIQMNPNFSAEIIRFIEERRETINIAKGISEFNQFYQGNEHKMAIE